MEQGWIKLHRKFRNSSFYSNGNAVHVWIECLLRAKHDKDKFILHRQKVELKPGQFVMGRAEFGEKIGISGSTAWFWILDFKKRGMLDIKTSNKGTIITILNWKDYQGLDSKKTAELTTKKQQKNTIKNVKNNNTNVLLESTDSEPFSINEKIELLLKSEKRYVQIIGLYWKYLGTDVPVRNKDQYTAQFKRNVRGAKNLTGYTDEEINAAMEKIDEVSDYGKKFKWTIETILKYINQ